MPDSSQETVGTQVEVSKAAGQPQTAATTVIGPVMTVEAPSAVPAPLEAASAPKKRKPRGPKPKPEVKHCTFPGCDRKSLSFGLCWTHYQQQRRGRPLTPIRMKGLLLLPGNVRVEASVHSFLQKRVQAGKAKTMYEATRQAIVAGVQYWLKGGK
jgi:hypothetical protein